MGTAQLSLFQMHDLVVTISGMAPSIPQEDPIITVPSLEAWYINMYIYMFLCAARLYTYKL